MAQGICNKKTKGFSLVTVTDKGQIAIPCDLRRELGIEQGDKLIAIKRADGRGLNLLRLDVVGEVIDRLTND